VVLEKADRVGGTWRENTYPGCGCDIPAPAYSFSFNSKPQWRTNFALPRRFPESRDSRARCSTPRDGTTSWPRCGRRSPRDFTLGSERLLLSNTYLLALSKPNVELIPHALVAVDEHDSSRPTAPAARLT